MKKLAPYKTHPWSVALLLRRAFVFICLVTVATLGASGCSSSPTGGAGGNSGTDASAGGAGGNSGTDASAGGAGGNSSTDASAGGAGGNSGTDASAGGAGGNSSTDASAGGAGGNSGTDASGGNIYYVSPNGSDSNDGSIDHPWATIMHAVENSGPGDTVMLRGGTYTESVKIRGDHGEGGASGAFWTLQAYQHETAIMTGGIDIYMTSYVRIKGLEFENSSISLNSYVKDGWSFPDHSEILGNTLIGPQQRYCMIGVIGNDNLIEGNTITVTGGGDSLDHGIYVMSGSRNIIRNNNISGTEGFGIHIYDEVKQKRSGQITDDIIEGNVITGSKLSAGIIVATGSSGSPLAKNITIRNNIIYANGVRGIEVRSNAENVYIYNNTLYRNGKNGDGIRVATCCGSSGYIKGVMVENNIIDIGASTGYHVKIGNDGAVSGLVLENNLYWPGPPRLDNVTDSHAVTGNPLFVDPPADFHLKAASAAIDKGLPLTEVLIDKDGVSRPQGSAYDIGAYEYH